MSESEKMHKTLLLQSVFALAIATAIPPAVGEEAEAAAAPEAVGEEAKTAAASNRAGGEEADACDAEKGPCCELDWTGQGATIVKIQGDALVSQSPWVDAVLGMRVRNGGRVLTLDRSTAVCAFDDGCWHVLKENQMLTIGDVSPCCAEPVPAVAPVPPAPPPALPPALANPTWLIPALPVAAIGACAATDCIGDSDDDPDPPRTAISR